MFLSVTLLVALHAVPDDKPKDAPASRELFAGEDWYKNEKGKEQEFIGTLSKIEQGGVGIGRFNPYRLKMEKETREVYIGGKPALLAPYVGKKVKITGKPVEMEVVGKIHNEIWPARIEVVKEKEKDSRLPGQGVLVAEADKESELKVTARAFWRPAGGIQGKAQQLVIRNGAEAATAMGKGKDAEAATNELAKLFKVESIDWKKQMVVVVTAGPKPTGGYSVTIDKLVAADKQLTVKWTLKSPGPGDFVTQAFTHPAQAALTEQFEGKVKFDPAAPKGGGGQDK